MGKLVRLSVNEKQKEQNTESTVVQGKTGRLVRLSATQQTTAPQASFTTNKEPLKKSAAEQDTPSAKVVQPESTANVKIQVPQISQKGTEQESEGEFTHSGGKIDLPTLGERVGKTLTGAGKQYASGMTNAAGLASAGQGGTAQGRVYEEQAGLLDEQIASLEASLDSDSLTDRQRQETLDTIEQAKQQRDIYGSAVRSGAKTADEVYKLADEMANSGTEDIERAKEGLGTLGEIAVDTGVAGAQMLGDAALGMVTGSALAPMFFRSSGGAAQEARMEGASHEQQLAYGLASGALSVATEKIANVAAPFKKAFGGGVLDKAIDRALAKMNGSAAGKLALGFLSEGGEEVVEDLVQPLLQGLYNGKSVGENYSELELSEVLYDGLIGGILGGLGSGVEIAAGKLAGRGAQQTTAPETAPSAPQTAQERAETLGGETTLPAAQNAPTARQDALDGGRRVSLEQYATGENIDRVSQGLNDGTLAVDAFDRVYRPEASEHIDQRTSGTVGSRSMNAFQFDHPELHQYYRETAAELLEELHGTERGGETIRVKAVGVGDDQYLRMKRLTTDRIAHLLDDERISYSDIERALDAIINNHGQENFAAAKRVELMLDDMLTNGYKSIYGEEVAPNEDYLAAKRAIPGADTAEPVHEELPIWDIAEAEENVSQETVRRRIEQVRDAAAALGLNGSRALSTVYDESAAARYAPEEAMRDFYQVYNAALHGTADSNTTAPDYVRLAAQNAGERDARVSTQAKYFGKNAGLVRDGSWKKANLTSKESYALDALGKVTGTQIRFADTIDGGSANASYRGGVITLALDAKNPVMASAVHETVHRVRETSPEAYAALVDFVHENMSEEGMGANLAVRGKVYQTSDTDTLTEELVADAFGQMLEKSDVLDQFATQHRSAAQTIMDALHDLVVKIKRALGSKEVRLSDNQKAAFRDLEGKVREMETLFAKALESAQGKENAANEGGGAKFSIKMLDDGRYYVKSDRQVLRGDDPTKWGKQLQDYINTEIRKGHDIVLPTTDGQTVRITERSAYKLSDDKTTSLKTHEKTKLSDENYRLKEEAASHIDEIVLTGEFSHSQEDIGGYHENDIGEDGFNTYTAYFEDSNGEYYRINFVSALNGGTETAYSIGDIQKRKKLTSGDGSSARESSALNGGKLSNERVAQSSSGVKPKYSLKIDSEKSWRDYENAELLDPNQIIPVNDVTDKGKYKYLVKEFKERGYDGRPVVVYESPYGWQALTGSHRVSAAKEAGIEIPALLVENAEAAERLSRTMRDSEMQQEARELYEEGLIDQQTMEVLTREEDLNYENYGVPYAQQTRYSLKTIDEMEQRLNDINEEYRGLEKQDAEFQTAPEYLALMDAIDDARASKRSLLDKPEALSKAIDSYSVWQKESGYSKVIHRMEELRGEMKTLRGKIDSARKQAAQEAKAAVRAGYSDSMAKKYAAKAARKFGTTRNFDLAGYLTVNGTLLDFSDRQGYRVKDHREITDILDFLPTDHGYSDGMIEFMNLGNIRLQSYGIDISKAPNTEQRAMLRKFFLSKNGDVTVDFSDENGRSAGSLEYSRGTSADRILNDIDTYFAAGNIPNQSVVSQFHGKYSLNTREALDEYIEQYGEIPTGEKPHRTVRLPLRTEQDKYVSRTIRTVLEAKATPDAMVPTLEDMVAAGDFSYDRYTDKQAVSDAESRIRTQGWQKTLNQWKKSTKNEVSKEAMATGWALYNNAANSGDVETALEVLGDMVAKSRNAAQALQAVRLLKKQAPSAQLYGVQRSVEGLQEELKKEYGKNVPELEIDRALAEKFLNAKTDEAREKAMSEIYRDIGRQMPSRFIDKWNAWRYLSMLGNARTHVRNIMGNAGFAPLVGVKNLIGTGLESAANAASGGKAGRTKAILTAKDTGLVKAAWNDYANIAEQALGESKYDERALARKGIEEGRKIFGTTGWKPWDMTLGKALETVRKANSAALDAEDMWFSKPHYASALAQYCKANGITEAQIESGKGLEAARNYAIKEAQKATYRDTNAFSEMVSRMGRANSGNKNSAEKFGSTLLEGVLPFRKTPANILVRGVEYSPIELLKSISYDLVQVKRGEMEATEMLDHLSTGLTGTGIMALGAYMAAEGLLRGSGGGEEEKKDFDELRGHQGYALELPDGTSITLDWLAPEVLPLFVGANLVEQTRERSDGELATSDVLEAISNVSDPLLEMSCLQSLNDLFDSVGYAASDDTSALASVAASAATSYLTQALPTLLGQIERTGEGVRMTTYTDKNNKSLTGDMQYALGRASSRLPGVEYNQIPYIDAWGRTESSGSVGARAFNNFLNPAYTSQIESSAMEDELERLYTATGDAGVLPDRAAKYFSVGGERKDLTGEEYVAYATIKGQTAYATINDIVQRSDYKAMSDEDKADVIGKAYKLSNAIAKMRVSDYEPSGGIEKGAVYVLDYGIDPAQYVMLYTAQGEIESLKDKSGKTIDNSKGLQIMELVYQQAGLSDKQRTALFEAFGVGKSIQHYNKALVAQKLKAMRSKAAS